MHFCCFFSREGCTERGGLHIKLPAQVFFKQCFSTKNIFICSFFQNFFGKGRNMYLLLDLIIELFCS